MANEWRMDDSGGVDSGWFLVSARVPDASRGRRVSASECQSDGLVRLPDHFVCLLTGTQKEHVVRHALLASAFPQQLPPNQQPPPQKKKKKILPPFFFKFFFFY